MRSWLITTKAPRKRLSQSSSHSIAAMSRWLVGSSSSSTSGSCASARTMAARRRSPPDAERRLAIEVDAELIGDREGLVVDRRIVAAHHVIAQGGDAAQIGFLLEDDDARARHDRTPALVGIELAPPISLSKRRLAGAVAADQREPVALADVDVETRGTASRSLGPGRGLRRREQVQPCGCAARRCPCPKM